MLMLAKVLEHEKGEEGGEERRHRETSGWTVVRACVRMKGDVLRCGAGYVCWMGRVVVLIELLDSGMWD